MIYSCRFKLQCRRGLTSREVLKQTVDYQKPHGAACAAATDHT